MDNKNTTGMDGVVCVIFRAAESKTGTIAGKVD